RSSIGLRITPFQGVEAGSTPAVRLMYRASPVTRAGPGDFVDNVIRPWPFGRPPWLGVTLMKYVIHRQESYPENVGHGRSSVALEAPPTRVSTRLRKEPASTFGKSKPRSRQYQSRPEIDTGIGSVLNGRKHVRDFTTQGDHARFTGQPSNPRCLGEQQTAVGYARVGV